MTKLDAQAPRPIGSDLALIRALTTIRRRLFVAFVILAVLLAAWGMWGYSFDSSYQQTGTMVIAGGSVLVLFIVTWASLSLAVRSSMDLMMLWIGGGFLARLGIIMGTLLSAKSYDFDTRFIAISLLAVLIIATLIEVSAFARARIMTVNLS